MKALGSDLSFHLQHRNELFELLPVTRDWDLKTPWLHTCVDNALYRWCTSPGYLLIIASCAMFSVAAELPLTIFLEQAIE